MRVYSSTEVVNGRMDPVGLRKHAYALPNFYYQTFHPILLRQTQKFQLVVTFSWPSISGMYEKGANFRPTSQLMVPLISIRRRSRPSKRLCWPRPRSENILFILRRRMKCWRFVCKSRNNCWSMAGARFCHHQSGALGADREFASEFCNQLFVALCKVKTLRKKAFSY